MLKKVSMAGKINLTFAAFGIQFGSALQMANMSSIYKYLGANVNNLAFLWLAAPITGLLAQPIFGLLSDRTWVRFLGKMSRRAPYMLGWATVAMISMFIMPHSASLAMAAILLWMLDLSQNGATETFRAMLGDNTPDEQKTKIFALQTIFATGGATIAALLPWIMLNVFGIKKTFDTTAGIPIAIEISFYIGGVAFFLAVIWTVLTTKEATPEFALEPREEREVAGGSLISKIFGIFKELTMNIVHMPDVIKEFYPVQLFNWMGMFCMWLFFGVGIAQNIYKLPAGAKISGHPALSVYLEKGVAWCGVAFATYQIAAFLFSFFIPRIEKKIGGRGTHGIALICGGIGLMAALFIHNKYALLLCMVGVGITWGSIMTIPYSIIAAEVPKKKLGVYMGLFNMTITIPQIICALLLGFISRDVFHDHAMEIVFTGGVFLLIAGILMWRLQIRRNRRERQAA